MSLLRTLSAGCLLLASLCASAVTPVHTLPMKMRMLTGDRYYLMAEDGINAYMNVKTNILWPDSIGSFDIRPLQDSILAVSFGTEALAAGVDRAVEADLAFDGGKPIESAAQAPKGATEFYTYTKCEVADLTPQYITMKVTHASYTGGAHGNCAVNYFTYDFSTGTVLTLDNIFMKGYSQKKLLEILKENLANNLGVEVKDLGEAGIFVEEFTFPGEPYLENYTLKFHYNPYEIAPWSSGMIEVPAWLNELKGMLQPYMTTLLNETVFN